MAELARHRVVRRSFIGDRLLEPGAEVLFDPERAGSNLEPLEKIPRRANASGGGEAGPSARELIADIAETEDRERLQALSADERKTVAEAAMRRLAALEGGE